MKFTTSKSLTIAELESEEYKSVKEDLKTCSTKDFEKNIFISEIGKRGNKEVIKINSVEIIRNKGQIVPWVELLAKDFNNYYEISMNYYDSSDNFTLTFLQQQR